jgi:hypothetical protein
MDTVPVDRPSSSVETSPEGHRGHVRHLSVWRISLHLSVWLPLIVVSLRQFVHHWVPLADDAHLSLLSYSVWSGNFPLIGPVSLLSTAAHPVFDPGPLAGYALSPMVAVDPVSGILWGSAMLAGIVVSMVVEVLSRDWSFEVATVAGGAWSLLLITNPDIGLHIVWNPYIGMAFFFGLIASSLLAGRGNTAMLPFVVVFASLAVCCHTMLAAPSILLVVAAFAQCWAARSSRSRRWFWVAGALGVTCWLPPILQELVGSHPNLDALWRVTRSGASMGLSFGLRAVAHATPDFLVASPHLSGSGDSVTYLSSRSPLIGIGLILVVAAVTSWATVTKQRSIATSGWTTLAILCGEVASFAAVKARVTFGLSYTAVFLWAGAAMVTVLLAQVIGVVLARRDWLLPLERLRPLGFAVVLLLSVGATITMSSHPLPGAPDRPYHAVRESVAWIEHHVEKGPVRIAVVIDGSVGLDSASQLFGIEYLLRTDGYSPPDDQILENGAPVTRGPLVFIVETHDIVRHIGIFTAKPS